MAIRIGLYGIGGVYNFGCEAIIRGAVKFIKRIYPDALVIYFSNNYEYDKAILKDVDIKIISIRQKPSLAKKVINKGLSFTRIEKRLFNIKFKEIMSQVDEIWSIGGDIYTIPAVKRERQRYKYYNHLIDFCNRTIDAGKEVVVYGASIGPFGNYKDAVQYYVKNLSRYRHIFCRENVTLNYLESLGLSNVSFFPDPAFQISDGKSSRGNDRYIGLNVSPLSLNEIYGNHNDKNVDMLAQIIDQIIEKFDKDILLIPHVISKDENDDDLRFQNRVLKRIENYNRVKIAEYNGGFLGLKPQLRECEFVVSARMHCAINALVENVPAIFLSYSQKSLGICEYVYGSQKWALKINNIRDELIGKMLEMHKEINVVRNILRFRNHEIQLEYEKKIQSLINNGWKGNANS